MIGPSAQSSKIVIFLSCTDWSYVKINQESDGDGEDPLGVDNKPPSLYIHTSTFTHNIHMDNATH